MNRIQRGLVRRIGQHIHRFWPNTTTDPVFVIGCPRSGTTIFGELLGRHPRILYLHEPRYIWRHIDPRLNVWRGDDTRGQLSWPADDADPDTERRLAQWFNLALTVNRRKRLVEKTPLNIFRVRWLAAMFPEAKFVYLTRHPRDVALSLERAIDNWFSTERGYSKGYWETSWHYTMFEDFASSVTELAPLPSLVRKYATNYSRALLVWACCTWAGLEAASDLSPARWLCVHYESLVEDPVSELPRVFTFIGEPIDAQSIGYAQQRLHGDSVEKPDPVPEATSAIAGRLLDRLGCMGPD